MDSILGKTILGYNVIERIGTGGFGEVYKVERNNIVGNATRALKVVSLPKENQYMEILNSMGGDSEKADNYFKQELERVVNEIRVFSMISEKDNHHIVSYYENDVQKVGKYKYNIYILMEMLTPLDKWLTMNNLTVEQGIDIGLGVANALKICHENQIMHRDIKVNNVFASKDGKFKLGDFGVSKRFDTLTRANTIKGTPYYIAPEVYIGNSKYNNSVDIYSLGILLYYLFNKRRYPFYPNFPDEYNQEDEDRAFFKRMKYEVPPIPVGAPEGVANIILKALAQPGERYSDAESIINDLEDAKSRLTKEELTEYIGFEPVNMEKNIAESKKEKYLVNNLDGINSKSISFGEYTMDTESDKKAAGIRIEKRPVIIAAILLALMIVGYMAASLWMAYNPKPANALPEESSTTVVGTTSQQETTSTEETTLEETTTPEETTTKKPKKEPITTTKPPSTSKSNDSGGVFNFNTIIE